MTTPVGTHVREAFEPMRYPVVEFLLVRVCLRVGLAYALRNNLAEALLMTCVLAVLTLHPSRVFQEISAQCTSHDTIELLDNKLVTILLLYFLFPLPYRTFPVEPQIKWSSVLGMFCCEAVSYVMINELCNKTY